MRKSEWIITFVLVMSVILFAGCSWGKYIRDPKTGIETIEFGTIGKNYGKITAVRDDQGLMRLDVTDSQSQMDALYDALKLLAAFGVGNQLDPVIE